LIYATGILIYGWLKVRHRSPVAVQSFRIDFSKVSTESDRWHAHLRLLHLRFGRNGTALTYEWEGPDEIFAAAIGAVLVPCLGEYRIHFAVCFVFAPVKDQNR
jgi:hypothetical protein